MLFVAFSILSFGQKVEGGILAGGCYYVGDLNPDIHLGENTNLVGGVLLRYTFNTRTAIRAGFLYSELEADDALSTNRVRQNRNLNFHSPLKEFSLAYEINFVNYALGDRAYWISPYVFAGFAFFRMNPMTDVYGVEVRLHSIGTEGQYVAGSGVSPYKLGQIAIPFGVGIKLNPIRGLAPFKWMSLNIEWGLRKTYTDYMDDVSNTYIDPTLLSPIGQDLADKGLIREGIGDTNWKMERGDVRTKDWYGMLTASLNVQIGSYGRSCKYLYR